MKQCPRCASDITKNDKVCPRCGLPVDKMNFESEEEIKPQEAKLTKVQKRERKKQIKAEKKAERKARKLAESRSSTDFSQFAVNSEKSESVEDVLNRKNRKKKELNPTFELDDNGEFNIETKDVEIVGEETGKLIEERQKQTYSIKKARGDFREPKIKWWEIYKLADRYFARRKIKKEVNKAAKIKPDFIKKSKLALLAIFLGWTGAHNFYAKNKKKGWVSIVSLIVWLGVIYLSTKVKFFAAIQVSVGGFAGFVNIIIWFGDAINILFNNFRYRIQKEAFIFGMNVKTRAKLGEKYIDLELYQKPWWFRFKVWCQKKKRDYAEWKHDRRQRLIEREKEKQAQAEKQAKIDAEIAEFEEKELQQIKAEKSANKNSKTEAVKETLKNTKVLDDIKTFENENEETEQTTKTTKTTKTKQAPKKAKVTVSKKSVKSKKNTKK